MEPTELTEMIHTVQAQHARQHEIWMALHPIKDDHPVMFAMVNTLTAAINTHLDALYALRTLLNSEVPATTI